MPFSYHSKRLDTKFLFSWKGRHDLWPHFSLQTSPKLPKLVQPSPRNRSRYFVRIRLRHLFGYTSGIGSLCHNPFKLDQWPYESFQMKPSLFKSVQPSPRNRSRYIVRRRLRHFFLLSPEPKVAAIIRLNLVNGTTSAFKCAQVCLNRFSHI